MTTDESNQEWREHFREGDRDEYDDSYLDHEDGCAGHLDEDDASLDRYTLSRDGQPIMTGSEGECWQYIHRNHSYSVSHALRHEGYSIRKEEE